MTLEVLIEMKMILVTGSRGQIGSDLVVALRRRYGAAYVVESGHRAGPSATDISLPYEVFDVRDRARLQDLIEQYHEELVAEIQKHLPDFTCRYAPDFRQAIADSWPTIIDDSHARKDWGWRPTCNLPCIVKDMLQNLSQRIAKQGKLTNSRGSRGSKGGNNLSLAL